MDHDHDLIIVKHVLRTVLPDRHLHHAQPAGLPAAQVYPSKIKNAHPNHEKHIISTSYSDESIRQLRKDSPRDMAKRKMLVVWHESLWRRASASRPNRIWHCLQVPPRPFFFPFPPSSLPPSLLSSALTIWWSDDSETPPGLSGMVAYTGSPPCTSISRVGWALGIVCRSGGSSDLNIVGHGIVCSQLTYNRHDLLFFLL